MTVGNHSERIQLAVTKLGNPELFLGMDWLKDHNPSIDWTQGRLSFDRCPDACGYTTELRDAEDDEDDDDLFEDLNTMEVPEEDNLPRPSGSYATRIDDEEDLVQRLERLKVRDSPEARSPTLSKEEEEQYLYLLRKKYPGKDFH